MYIRIKSEKKDRSTKDGPGSVMVGEFRRIDWEDKLEK